SKTSFSIDCRAPPARLRTGWWQVADVPTHRFPEAFADTMGRGVEEQPLRLRNIGLRVAHVAFPELPVVRPGVADPREMIHEQRALHLEELVERRALPHRDVVDLIERRRVPAAGGEQVHLDRIYD